MINEVMIGTEEGGADFAIADLSVTSARNEAVQFSIPWMNLGISIIFVKPRKAPPSLLSFLSPFTIEVWMYVGFGKKFKMFFIIFISDLCRLYVQFSYFRICFCLSGTICIEAY